MPGLVLESAGPCLVLTVFCPGLALASLGLGLVLEDVVVEAEPDLVLEPAVQGFESVRTIPVLVLLEAVVGKAGLVHEPAALWPK